MRKHGFTLVELMIVIAIIAVLATVIMPKMGMNREKAKLQACILNLHQIGVALHMYMNENQGDFPKSCTIDSNNVLVTGGYLKTVPKCPGNVTGASNCYEVGGQHWECYVCCKNPGQAWHPSQAVSRPVICVGSGQPY